MILDEQDLDRVLVLKRIPLFRYLSLDTLLAVSRAMQSRQYLQGDVIVRAGERPEYCHFLEAGTVSLGRDPGAETLQAPACLNEVVLIDEAMLIGPVVALEPCRVLRLHAVVLQDLSRDHPEILLELCRTLARRIRAAESARESPRASAGNGCEPTLPAGEGVEGGGPEKSMDLVAGSYGTDRGTNRILNLLRGLLSKSYAGNE